MKITDPSLWPADVTEIQLQPLYTEREAYDLLSGAGVLLAEMTALDALDRPIGLDHVDGTELSVDGCWEIAVVDRDGALIENRVLFRPPSAPGSATLGTELRAWATLTVLWARGGDARRQG